MNEAEFGNERGIGSVKAAISRYGGTINRGSGLRNKSQKNASDLQQEKESKAQELHIAKKKVDRINENRKLAETVKSQAEFELVKAEEVVRGLSAQIEISKSKVKQKTEELENLDMIKSVNDQSALNHAQMEHHQHTEVIRELEILKREVSKIKLDTARALEEKSRAEKEVDAAALKIRSFTETVEQLGREIEEANEEEVLVELAKIQARKELAAIEAQRKEEEKKMSLTIQETRKKIEVLRNGVQQIKQLEDELSITKSDADVLQNELKFIKEMDKRTDKSVNPQSGNSVLLSATKDLKAAKTELDSISAEAFQLMSSMDVIRNELNTILKEKGGIEKAEAKTEKKIGKLNTKLLREKDKLEAARAAEEKSKLMLTSFDLSLKELQKEKEAANKEKKFVEEETASLRDEVQKTEYATDSVEDRLWDIMEELGAVKKAEENALKKLKNVAEKAAIARASKNTSTITISKFEYDYLIGSAKAAEELAGNKAAAAHAWAEAVRAHEKEMQIKTALAERQIKELRQKEDHEFLKIENSVNETQIGELEIHNQREQDNKPVRGRRSMAENSYNLNPARQTTFRKSIGSPATRRPIISTPLTVKRKRKGLHKLGKYFASKQTDNEKSDPLDESQ